MAAGLISYLEGMAELFSRSVDPFAAFVRNYGLLCLRSRSLPYLIFFAALTGLAGCYSFSGTTLPSHLRTLRILPVGNKTLESALPDKVSQGLEDGFRQRTNLRKVNEGGDAELSATLTSYSHRPQSISGDRVTHYRVDILLSVAFVDREKGDTLYQDSQVPGYGPYSIDKGETEELGQKLAIESAVKVILDQAVSGW